ncbi:hypothetical protein FACS1894208_01790 [Clostridia bacterium]|nr:hypothetical protein FACS1894208_01790 [Clostridia bacterium]
MELATLYDKYPTYSSYIEPLKALVPLNEKDLQRYENKYYEKSKCRNGAKDAQYYHAYAELLNDVISVNENRVASATEVKLMIQDIFAKQALSY